jgi:hypothetical protein
MTVPGYDQIDALLIVVYLLSSEIKMPGWIAMQLGSRLERCSAVD